MHRKALPWWRARMLWLLILLEGGIEESVERMIWRTSWLDTLRHVKALSEKGISTLEVPRDCNLRGTGTEGLELRDWNRNCKLVKCTGALHSFFSA